MKKLGSKTDPSAVHRKRSAVIRFGIGKQQLGVVSVRVRDKNIVIHRREFSKRDFVIYFTVFDYILPASRRAAKLKAFY